MQKYVSLVMVTIAAMIIIIHPNHIQAVEVTDTNNNKRAPIPLDPLEAVQCLPTSCGSFGCCSGNCQPWCRACGVPHACG